MNTSPDIPASPPRRRAFTLVELLVVVAIIALLVSILMPALGGARNAARKAACASQLNGHGKILAMYTSRWNSYPFMGNAHISVPGNWDASGAWSKFYGIMEEARVAGSVRTSQGMWAYLYEPDKIWDGTPCPGQNAVTTWKWAEAEFIANRWPNMLKAYYHRAAIGYQWNPCLRAQTPGAPYTHCNSGRWAPEAEDLSVHANVSSVRWTDYVLHFPNDAKEYAAQAVRPEEVDTLARVAEAWDSMDPETVPGANWSNWQMENTAPGWHVGPQSRGTKGWALLNASRHFGSPNILYGDGHVSADATRELAVGDLDSCPGGTWAGMRVNSWTDFDTTFGSNNHILPRVKKAP